MATKGRDPNIPFITHFFHFYEPYQYKKKGVKVLFIVGL
jgi:hypothetical protein